MWPISLLPLLLFFFSLGAAFCRGPIELICERGGGGTQYAELWDYESRLLGEGFGAICIMKRIWAGEGSALCHLQVLK